MKTKPFSITLLDKYGIDIPEAMGNPFTSENKNRVKVEATNNDNKLSYHAALKKNKNGGYRMYLSMEKQKELDVTVGDTFTLQLFEDQSKYGVEMPEALNEVLLSDVEAYKIFETLTPGKQRSIIYSIKRYKSLQTQVDKSIIITDNLKRGVKDLKLLLKSK
ncbi:YdeI/OmpD-associated family protein [Lacinutrix chionoecetis]